MKKKIVFLVAIVAILGLVIKCKGKDGIADDYLDMQERGNLRVVTNFDALGYYVSGDTLAGYNYDLLQALQKRTDLKFEIFLENSLEKSFEGLRSGKYDLVARNIAINKNLREEYNFTDAVYRNKLILVQRKAEYNNKIQPIRNHLQLGKTTLYITKGDPALFRIRNLSHEIGDTIFVVEDTTYGSPQLAMMVASGDIDYAVCDEITALNLAKKLPQLDVTTDIGFTHIEAWAVRSTSPVLLDSLNSWINYIISNK